MKIVHLCVIGTITEGLTYQDNLLPKYHVVCGHSVTIITHCYTRNKDYYIKIDSGTEINNDGVKIIRLPLSQGKNNLSRFKRLKGLYETIEQEIPDILFVHGLQFLDVDVIIRYKKNYPKVVIFVDNHADLTNSASNWISYYLLHKIIWKNCAIRLLPYVDKFYGVLPVRVDFLIDIYGIPKDKVELLVMGADDEAIKKVKENHSRETIRKKYNVHKNDILIVTGGRIDRHKFQTLNLMEVVNEIPKDNIKIIVFGGVSDDLKERVLATESEKVRYIGWIDASESYSFFEAADLVVFPGRHSVFWEQATGQGKPLLVRRWKGTEHIDLGGNAEYLEDDTKDEMFCKLKDLIENPLKLQYMETIAKEKGMQRFSYKNIAEKSIKI